MGEFINAFAHNLDEIEIHENQTLISIVENPFQEDEYIVTKYWHVEGGRGTSTAERDVEKSTGRSDSE